MKARMAAAALVPLVLLTACDTRSGKWWWDTDGADASASSPASTASAPTRVASPVSAASPASAQDAPPVAASAPAPVDVPPIAPSAAASATDPRLVPFKPASSRADSAPARCAFDGLALPSAFTVYAAGAYSGRKLDYQIDQSGHEATQIDVAVDQSETPVVLMLGAYEPTVWNIGWTPRTRILAVLVSGYHRQAIAGLPPSVPRLNSSYDNKGPCGYFYVSQDNLGKLNPIARGMFGQAVTRVFLVKDGFVAVGNGTTTGLVTDANQPPDQFRNREAPLAGEAGLRDAVAKGLLREARSSDLRDWQAAFDAVNRRDEPPVSGAAPPDRSDVRLHNAYVVLRPMQLPAGLYGAHSATFIVPRGVQRPTGNPGHSRVLDHNTLTCIGATCDRD